MPVMQHSQGSCGDNSGQIKQSYFPLCGMGPQRKFVSREGTQVKFMFVFRFLLPPWTHELSPTPQAVGGSL